MVKFFLREAKGGRPAAECIEIPVPTNLKDTVTHVATEKEKRLYAAEYKAFKASVEPAPKATPRAPETKAEAKAEEPEAKPHAKHTTHKHEK